MTEAMVDDALVEVTPEDRVFAAWIFIAPTNAKACLAGERDDHPIVQKTARHRLAGVAAGREEAWQEVEARLTQVQQVAIDAGRHGYLPAEQAVVNFATDAMSAIRQRGE